MPKEEAITVRLPRRLKRQLAARAKREHRSLSGQVVHELEQAVGAEAASAPSGATSALGLFGGAALPTEEDFAEVRRSLWGRLGSDDG